jgi:acylphosphatase
VKGKKFKKQRVLLKDMRRVHIIISGRVQGVFFRYSTNKVGNKLGLKGFVRNLSDGNVEVVAEGDEDKLKEMIEFCKKGPMGAHVENVKIEYGKATGEFDTFSIGY